MIFMVANIKTAKVKKSAALLATAALAASMAFAPAAAFGADNSNSTNNDSEQYCSRISGEDRLATMQAVSKAGFESADTVIVTSAQNFPDALSSTALAGYYKSPILLTNPSSLSPETSSEIERLEASEVIIAGGPSAVSDEVASQIEEIVGDGNVERIAGADRYQTAQEIYEAGVKDGVWGKTAVVASGNNFADAMSMSPYSYAQKAPTFLADSNGELTQETKQAIAEGGFDTVVIAGGDQVVSEDTENELASDVASDAKVVRLAGGTRYETSAKVATWCAENGLGYSNVSIASGEDFADALTGGALCGSRNSVMMLVGKSEEQAAPATEVLKANAASMESVSVLGGSAAVSDEIKKEVETSARVYVDFSNAQVDTTNKEYSGEAITPQVTCGELVEGTDFVVTYENNVNVGTAKVTVEGIGKWGGSSTFEFTIEPKQVDLSGISLDLPHEIVDAQGFFEEGCKYNGSERKPAVKNIPEGLVEGTDYEITYANNIHAGQASATVKCMGNYTGEATKEFTIYQINFRDDAGLSFTMDDTKLVYKEDENGNPVTQTKKLKSITFKGKELVEGVDYRLEGNTGSSAMIGYVMYLWGLGDYTGMVDVGFWNIEQADLSADKIPSNLSATGYMGETLADTNLPTLDTSVYDGTLVWEDSTQAIANTPGEYEYEAVYTPSNINYKSATVKVKVTVPNHIRTDDWAY